MDNQLEENLPGAPEPNLGGNAEDNLEGIVPANEQGNLGAGIQASLELNRQRSSETDNIFREIFLEGENLSELSMVQQGFIRVIRGIEQEIGTDTTGAQVKEMVAESYPPEMLFDPDLASYPRIYIKLRNWLDKHGAALGNHPTRRVYNLLADRLYAHGPERDQAQELARKFHNTMMTRASYAGTPRQGGSVQGGGAHPRGAGHGLSPDRIGQSIGMRYSKDSMKFTGAEDQALHEYVGLYLQITRDFSVSNEQKLQFMYNIFDGEAKRYFDDHVDGRVATFSEAVLLMNKQYNSTTRQTAVQNRLSSLRFGKLLKQGMDDKTALQTIYKTITKLAPQLPTNYRDDTHKRDYLRLAVVGVPWARAPLGRLTTVDMNFEELYAALISELQLAEEFDAANDPNPNGGMVAQVPSKAYYFAGQGMYGKSTKSIGMPRPTYARGKAPAKADGRTRFDPLTIAGCFNCDDPKHLLKNCPKPVDAIRATKRKVEYYDKKTNGGRASVAAVLYQLTLQLNPTATVEGANDLEDVLVCGTREGPYATTEETGQYYTTDNSDDDDDGKSYPSQGSSAARGKHVGFAQGV